MAKTEAPKKKTKRPTAEKRMIQNEKKRLINRTYKSQVRTAVRKFENSLQQKNPEEAKTDLSSVFSLVDKCVKKGIYKRNKAARSKSRLAARLATLS